MQKMDSEKKASLEGLMKGQEEVKGWSGATSILSSVSRRGTAEAGQSDKAAIGWVPLTESLLHAGLEVLRCPLNK